MAKDIRENFPSRRINRSNGKILRNHGYPPDLSAEAVQTVLQQAETLAARWAA